MKYERELDVIAYFNRDSSRSALVVMLCSFCVVSGCSDISKTRITDEIISISQTLADSNFVTFDERASLESRALILLDSLKQLSGTDPLPNSIFEVGQRIKSSLQLDNVALAIETELDSILRQLPNIPDLYSAAALWEKWDSIRGPGVFDTLGSKYELILSIEPLIQSASEETALRKFPTGSTLGNRLRHWESQVILRRFQLDQLNYFAHLAMYTSEYEKAENCVSGITGTWGDALGSGESMMRFAVNNMTSACRSMHEKNSQAWKSKSQRLHPSAIPTQFSTKSSKSLHILINTMSGTSARLWKLVLSPSGSLSSYRVESQKVMYQMKSEIETFSQLL
ncbi:hypothetical protein JYT16_02235, partial [Gemmatimonas aurantiaca]|nr:hypothetical protein [Gemmatimonas aurantiaca]